MTAEMTARLAACGGKVIVSPRLADYTTFRLGGTCPLLVHCRTPGEVTAAVRELAAAGQRYVLIGGGSNLLVSDDGLESVVVRYVADTPAIRAEGDRVRVSGGTLLDDLAAFSIGAGLDGLVHTSGIPGTVGGAIVGNAGAFGWQVADGLESVELLGTDGNMRTASPDELGFSYRDSALKGTGEIVLAATFRLPGADRDELAATRADHLKVRHGKHPDLATDACAGSFFRNIEPTSKAEKRQAAGWFLERAGVKSIRVGGAAIFPKHANIIVKGSADCRAADVLELSRRMASAVRETFGFELIREVQLLGHFGE